MNKLNLTLCIIFTLAISSCRHEKSKPKMPPLKVEVARATLDSLYHRISVASQIEAMQDAVVQPRVDGFLESIHYIGGEPVRQGDLLFTVDPSTFATTLYSARAALESARATEILAQRNYERAEPLAAIDAISKSDLDQYRATYKSALASTRSAEESLRSAELEIGYTKIYAPISGVASKTTAAKGDYIGPGTLQSELTTISQVDTVLVELPISTATYLKYLPADSGSIDNSSMLSDIVMTLPDSSVYEHRGEYYYTIKNTPTRSSTVVIVVKFPNPSLLLKEGMFARVAANIGARRGSIVVPKAAVSQLQGVNSLWVIKHDSVAEWRTVALGATHGELWEILSGVEAGESVVVGGALKLHNGVKVAATQVK